MYQATLLSSCEAKPKPVRPYRPGGQSYFITSLPAEIFMQAGFGSLNIFVATLRSRFRSLFSNSVAVYPEQSEGSHTCMFCNSIQHIHLSLLLFTISPKAGR